jgi:hypothetical protein
VEARAGPVTAYQVIVLPDNLPRGFTPATFVNFNAAQEEGLPYWVAAQLGPNKLGEFTVGDGRLYGGFWNHRLPPGRDWRVGLAVLSTLHGVTKRSYSGGGAEERRAAEGRPAEEAAAGPSTLVLGLTVAIVVAALVLMAALAVFIYLRHSLGTRWGGGRLATRPYYSVQTAN